MTMTAETWEFKDAPAARVATPLLVGLVGPSGTGKTYSALRLATGMQRVTGGEVFFIDTESSRALHYAPLPGEKADPARGTFNFQHVPFSSPYGSLRYLAAIEHCAKRGAKVIVVDSMSHEHDGVGGVLEQHQAEAERLAAEYKTTVDAVKMSAWGVPKANRRRLINAILTEMSVSCIFCFRAKNKLHVATKEEKKSGMEAITQRGFCPIAGEEFIYELMLKCVLLPGANGVPTWKSDYPGEKEMMKMPGQFEHIFERPAQLSEAIGQQLAEWAAGGNTKTPSDEECAAVVVAVKSATDADALEAAADAARGKPWSKVQRKAIADAVKARRAEIGGAP
jgi:ABC-type oligopeptide transport system ATPase subunit